MTCFACKEPLSRNHFLRTGIHVCSRACAMRLGGDGWKLVRVEGLKVRQAEVDEGRTRNLAQYAAYQKRYRIKQKADHAALMAKMLDGL